MTAAEHWRKPVAILVGAPGAGKSTIGRKIAEAFHLPFVDTDQVIEERAGMSVSDIFVTKGEEYFRELEAQVVAETVNTEVGIVALGGGAVTNPGTRQLLAGQRVLWLKVDAKDAARRVGLNTARPLLVGNVHGTLQKLLAERELWYAEVQTETVDTSQKSVRDVVAEAVALLEAR